MAVNFLDRLIAEEYNYPNSSSDGWGFLLLLLFRTAFKFIILISVVAISIIWMFKNFIYGLFFLIMGVLFTLKYSRIYSEKKENKKEKIDEEYEKFVNKRTKEYKENNKRIIEIYELEGCKGNLISKWEYDTNPANSADSSEYEEIIKQYRVNNKICFSSGFGGQYGLGKDEGPIEYNCTDLSIEEYKLGKLDKFYFWPMTNILELGFPLEKFAEKINISGNAIRGFAESQQFRMSVSYQIPLNCSIGTTIDQEGKWIDQSEEGIIKKYKDSKLDDDYIVRKIEISTFKE